MFEHEKQNLLEAVGLDARELVSVANTAVKAVEEGVKAAVNSDGSLNITAALAASGGAVLAMMEHSTVGIAVLAVSSFKELMDLHRQGTLTPLATAFLGSVLSSLEAWGVDFRKKERISEIVEALCEMVPKPVLIDKTLALFGLLLKEKGMIMTE